MFLKYEFAVRVRDLLFASEDLKGVGIYPHSQSVPDILALWIPAQSVNTS